MNLQTQHIRLKLECKSKVIWGCGWFTDDNECKAKKHDYVDSWISEIIGYRLTFIGEVSIETL